MPHAEVEYRLVAGPLQRSLVSSNRIEPRGAKNTVGAGLGWCAAWTHTGRPTGIGCGDLAVPHRRDSHE
jgi:hypothetical protein